MAEPSPRYTNLPEAQRASHESLRRLAETARLTDGPEPDRRADGQAVSGRFRAVPGGGPGMTASASKLKAPFPYFGGKSRVTSLVWERFGDVRNYVEPFFGSGAMLLGRPLPFRGPETVNDADGLLANFWRALQADPEAVAHWADWPVNENDLHARHAWLVERKESLQSRLEGDPDWFDAKVAGWWVWGISAWIGSGWCSGQGPWRAVESGDGDRILAKIRGEGPGVGRSRPLLHCGGAGVHRPSHRLKPYLAALADRLRAVRVCCGDWSRVTGHSVTTENWGVTAVFLDPPYLHSVNRKAGLYRVDSATVADSVREWAIANGDNPRLRIALCGYDGEHDMPDSWSEVAWKTAGGYGGGPECRGRANAARERIWFSPHCLKPADPAASASVAA